jgi:hypothetical protein
MTDEEWSVARLPAEQLGESDHHTLDIHIRLSQDVQQQADTLLHEIMHCCVELGGRLKTWADDADTDEVEEHAVARLCSPLLAVLVDNPSMLKWITEQINQAREDA